MAAALTRYRIMAWIVGVLLIVLVLIGMPLKYFGDNPVVVATVGPLHGFLFILYLVTAVDICLRAKFGPIKTILVMIAGTVPFFSFVAEHVVTRDVRALLAAQGTAGGPAQALGPASAQAPGSAAEPDGAAGATSQPPTPSTGHASQSGGPSGGAV